jgi:hypothetical protein
MISDPVKGLARRHGSILQDEFVIRTYNPGNYQELLLDSKYHKVFTFFIDGVEYDLVYRSAACAVTVNDYGTFAYCLNKETMQFMPISWGTDALLSTLVQGGVSAITSVGQYLFIAGNSIIPTWTPTDVYTASSNTSLGAVWVRGGAYSRTFKITVTKMDGSTYVGTYKTLPSSFQDILDTSGILTADPDYQKKVNDAVNDYNANVTAYIGTAAADITPENIAEKLKLALTAAGCAGVTRLDSTVLIDNVLVRDISCDDSGDGSLLRAVGNEVRAADLVSAIHYVGKVVKVAPKGVGGEDAFYLKAFPRVGSGTGWQQVSWRESAGYTMQPDDVFCMATIVGGTLYIGANATDLAAAAGGVHPEFKANVVGDDVSSPLPSFFGNRIDYLGLFQDRLVIGSGSTILTSRPGDYLNWFRQTVLAQPANDPWEGFALGAEDDTIRYSTTYDRNLILYGKRFQYQISGRQALDPKTASIVTTSAYKDANDAPPLASGNFVFYAKYSTLSGTEEKATSLHQVQAGVIADTPESYEVTQQLSTYIRGKPVQLVCVEAPNLVVLRTDTERDKLYTYTYLDSANASERLFDSWSKWTWEPEVGAVIGTSLKGTTLLVYMLRHDGTNCWIACEQFSLATGLSKYPYLDSLRPYSAIAAGTGAVKLTTPRMSVAFGDTSDNYMIGTPMLKLTLFMVDYAGQEAALYGGFAPLAYVTPTNPFKRDRDGNAVTSGRLTLGAVGVSVQDSGGLKIEVQTSTSTFLSKDFSGSLLGSQTALIGKQPLATGKVTGLVGRGVQECTYTLRAKTWLPLTITAIEWSGQYFNNARRVS